MAGKYLTHPYLEQCHGQCHEMLKKSHFHMSKNGQSDAQGKELEVKKNSEAEEAASETTVGEEV